MGRRDWAESITVTDVGAEMNTLSEALPKECLTCYKAYIAAVKMLAVSSL